MTNLFGVGVALHFFSLAELYYNIPLAGLLQKHVDLLDSSQNTKNPSCVWHCTMKVYVLL